MKHRSSRPGRLSQTATIVIAVVIIAAVIAAITYYRGGTGNEGFAGSDSDYHMVMFKADWCPHCQSALPAYKNLMSSANGFELTGGKKMYFDIIDPDVDTDRVVISKSGDGMQIQVKAPYAASQNVIVSGFPTYILYGRTDGPTRYTGPLDRDSIAAFIAGFTGSA